MIAFEFKDEVELTLSKNKKRNKRDQIVSLDISNPVLVKTSQIISSIPTPLDNLNVTIFSSMNYKTRRRSHCYNRAHVWAYEIVKKFSTSQKKIRKSVDVFYTEIYCALYSIL